MLTSFSIAPSGFVATSLSFTYSNLTFSLPLAAKVSNVISIFNTIIAPLYSALIAYSVCLPSSSIVITFLPSSSESVALDIFNPFANNTLAPFTSTFSTSDGNINLSVVSSNKALYTLDVSSTALISTFSFFTTVVKSVLLISKSTFVSGSFKAIFLSTLNVVVSVFPSNLAFNLSKDCI